MRMPPCTCAFRNVAGADAYLERLMQCRKALVDASATARAELRARGVWEAATLTKKGGRSGGRAIRAAEMTEAIRTAQTWPGFV